MRSIGLFLLSLAILCGEDSGVPFAPPVLGFFFDPATKRIRSISGVPGGARVADAGGQLAFEKAVVAPASAHALATAPMFSALVLVRDLNRAPSIQAIPGASPHFDMAAFSPSGWSAALFSNSCNCIQVITGMPGAPTLARFVPVRDVKAVSIADDASTIAVAHSDFVEFIREGSEPSYIPGVSATVLAPAPDGSFAAGEAEQRSVKLIRGVDVIELASERDGLGKPVALAFDGNQTLLIASDDGAIHSVAVDGSERAKTTCECAVERIERALEAGLFTLGRGDAGPLWMLDTASAERPVFFVPFESRELQQ